MDQRVWKEGKKTNEAIFITPFDVRENLSMINVELATGFRSIDLPKW